MSLDSLDDAVFRRMNDVDFPVAKVLEGIDAAAAAGLAPVKVNMVVKRGVNEDSILPMARHFRGTGHILRFIEYMDVGHTNGWRMDDVVTAREIVEHDRRRDAARAGRRRTTPAKSPSAGATGTAAARSASSPRSRRRSAATARARGCPPKASSTPACSPPQGHDLRALLRGGATDDEIARRGRGDLDAARRPLLRDPHVADGEAREDRDVVHRRLTQDADEVMRQLPIALVTAHSSASRLT